MKIERVTDEKTAIYCNELLRKTILFEKKFDSNANSIVENEEFYEKEIQDENFILLVAKENDDITGFISAKFDDNHNSKTIHSVLDVWTIFVEEKARKTGVGSMLLKHVEKWAKEKFDCKFIELVAFAQNSNAISFYQKHNFNEQLYVRLRKEL